MVAFVPHDMDHFYDPPPLQFLEARADVRAGDAQSLGDLLRVKGPGRNVKERVNLRDGAIDAPARPHFAPVQDEFLFHCRQFLHQILLRQK